MKAHDRFCPAFVIGDRPCKCDHGPRVFFMTPEGIRELPPRPDTKTERDPR